MAYSAQQIADAYRATVGAGQMSEAQFVDRARNEFGVSDGQLSAARDVLLGGLIAGARDMGPVQGGPAGGPTVVPGGAVSTPAAPAESESLSFSGAGGVVDAGPSFAGSSQIMGPMPGGPAGGPTVTGGPAMAAPPAGSGVESLRLGSSSAAPTLPASIAGAFTLLGESQRRGDQVTSLTASRDDLQNRFNTLQQRYDELERRQRQRPPGTNVAGITGATLVDPGAMTTTEAPATTGPVYGPDGRMYSSVAAALAAGVTNYSFVRPTRSGTGLINGADTMASPPAATGNVNPGTQVTGAAQQTFNFGPPRVRLPGGLRNPWSA